MVPTDERAVSSATLILHRHVSGPRVGFRGGNGYRKPADHLTDLERFSRPGGESIEAQFDIAGRRLRGAGARREQATTTSC